MYIRIVNQTNMKKEEIAVGQKYKMNYGGLGNGTIWTIRKVTAVMIHFGEEGCATLKMSQGIFVKDVNKNSLIPVL